MTLGPKGRSNTRINWPTYLCHGELVLGKVYSCGDRHQRRGLVGGEVVGKFLGFPGHGKGRIGGFPQLTLQNRWTGVSWSGVETGQQRTGWLRKPMISARGSSYRKKSVRPATYTQNKGVLYGYVKPSRRLEGGW